MNITQCQLRRDGVNEVNHASLLRKTDEAIKRYISFLFKMQQFYLFIYLGPLFGQRIIF